MKYHTFTGTIDLDNLRPQDIKAVDFIPQLCRTNRWLGATKIPFSVGQHTLLCLYMAEQEAFTPTGKLAVALHDAAEAYIGDIPHGIKTGAFKELETKIQTVIAIKFGLDNSKVFEDNGVKEVDRAAMKLEGIVLIPHFDPDIAGVPTGVVVDGPEANTLRQIAAMSIQAVELSFFEALRQLVMN